MPEERGNERDIETMGEVIIEAARRYRDMMRRYIAEQIASDSGGASLDDLATRNQERFRETMRAEEELFALLDAFDAMRAREEREAPGRIEGV